MEEPNRVTPGPRPVLLGCGQHQTPLCWAFMPPGGRAVDDPRFDSLAKAFARATTRRTALATLLAALSLTPTRSRAATASCRAVVEGGVVSITRTTGLLEQHLAATAVARIPLPGLDGADRSPTAASATTTVRIGGTTLLEVDLATADDEVAVQIAFGPAFGTTAEARFVAGEDGQVRGVVAGREVVPFPAAVLPGRRSATADRGVAGGGGPGVSGAGPPRGDRLPAAGACCCERSSSGAPGAPTRIGVR